MNIWILDTIDLFKQYLEWLNSSMHLKQIVVTEFDPEIWKQHIYKHIWKYRPN